MGERESIFFKGVTIGRGRAPYPRVFEQTIPWAKEGGQQQQNYVGREEEMESRGGGSLEDNLVEPILRWPLKTDLGLLANTLLGRQISLGSRSVSSTARIARTI